MGKRGGRLDWGIVEEVVRRSVAYAEGKAEGTC